MAKLLPWLLISAGVIALGFTIHNHGYDKAEKKYTAEITRINTEYKAASEKNQAEQLAYKKQKEDEYGEYAKEADAGYAALRAKYNANLLRYAQNDLRVRASAEGTQVAIAERSDGPSSRPDLYADTKIAISYSDAQICVDNTARLQRVRVWGQSILAGQVNLSKPLLTNIPRSSQE